MKLNNLPKDQLMKALVENTPVAYIILDKNFRIQYINDYFVKLRHLDKAKVRGDYCYNLSNRGIKCSVCAVENALKTGRSSKILRKDILPDGTVRYIEDYAFPIMRDGSAKYIFEIMIDRSKEMKLRAQLENDFGEIVVTLSALLETKDKYTATHSASVKALSEKIAIEMGLSDNEIYDIAIAASLHDIGKVSIPLSIINKTGPLDDLEYNSIKNHPFKSFEMIKSLEGFSDVKDIVLQHHERFDGKGYPDKLSANDICIGAKIVCVADTYDAMTSTRSYRKALSHESALSEIIKNRGIQFDPDVVDAFLRINYDKTSLDFIATKSSNSPKQVERVLVELEDKPAINNLSDYNLEDIVAEDFVDDILANTPAIYAIFDKKNNLIYKTKSFANFFSGDASTTTNHKFDVVGRTFESKVLEIDLVVEVLTAKGIKYVDIYAIPFLNDVSPEYVVQVIFDRTNEFLLQKRHEEDFSQLIRILSETLDYHKDGASMLSQQIGEIAGFIAESIGLNENAQRNIVFAAYLRDIGLISIQDELTSETTALDLYEQHSEMSYKILQKLSGFEEVKEIVRYHHEQFDGGGFPSGISGRNIPLGSRIVAVAEAFCRITMTGKSPSQAYLMLAEDNGKSMDPDIVALLA